MSGKNFYSAFIVLLCAMSCFSLSVEAAGPDRLVVLTEASAPHSVIKNGQVVGPTTEFVRLLATKAGFKPEVRIMAWKAVMQSAETEPVALIYPIARTSEREANFIWLGHLMTYKASLYKLKTRNDIHIKKLEDVHDFKVAVIRRDVREEFLLGHGFSLNDKNVVQVSDNKEAFHLLSVGRVDLAPSSQLNMDSTCSSEAIDCNAFESAMPLGLTMDIYVAATRKTPPETLKRLQLAYDELVADGTLQRLLGKYSQ